MVWSSSNRRAQLPNNWRTLRAWVLQRDNRVCQIGGPDCSTWANEVDHIQPGDNHHPNNLQAVCHRCHATKTHAESMTWPPRNRPPEPHPGQA